MNFLKDRNLIIIAIVLVLLVGGFYLTNNKSAQKKDETKKSDQVNLKDNENNSDKNSTSETKTDKGVISVEPASNSSLTKAPTEVVLKLDKEVTAGSEIKVVSDKGVDVVSAGNKLTSDLKSLSAPVMIEVTGTYTVSYKLNWLTGGTSEGTYKFSVK